MTSGMKSFDSFDLCREKYRDLIDAADSIVDMQRCSVQVTWLPSSYDLVAASHLSV